MACILVGFKFLDRPSTFSSSYHSSVKFRWLFESCLNVFWMLQDADLGGHDQADDLSRDEHDSTTRRRRGRPSSWLLPYGRGNGGTGRRSKSGKHVRPAVSGWPERPEVLRVLLQARRPRQAVQVHRPEVHQPVQMCAEVLIHLRYHWKFWIDGT